MGRIKQYGKTVPKTWKELLETGKFISQKEKEKEKGTGDDELIIYNGLFPKYETSMISTRELIYSFRKKKESPFPEYSSQEAVNALNMIKKNKRRISIRYNISKYRSWINSKNFNRKSFIYKILVYALY